MGREESLSKGGIAVPIAQWRQWILLLATGILCMVWLSRLPDLERSLQERRQAAAVFQPTKLKGLTDDNLVDILSKMSLQDPLTKVSWDHAILTIDLLGTIPDDVWADLGRIIGFSYGEVHNVRQVLIRVYKDKGEGRTLLLAAETRRSDWTDKELARLQRSTFMMDPAVASKIRLSVSPSGRRWITSFAN
jgi:hypothetical protein